MHVTTIWRRTPRHHEELMKPCKDDSPTGFSEAQLIIIGHLNYILHLHIISDRAPSGLFTLKIVLTGSRNTGMAVCNVSSD